MSICHTVRFRVQTAKERQAREAIDAYITALLDQTPSARLYVAQPEPQDGHLEYLHVSVCPGEAGCRCDEPTSALQALQDAIGPLLAAPLERRDLALDHEGQPD
jgi:hypothetical protein